MNAYSKPAHDWLSTGTLSLTWGTVPVGGRQSCIFEHPVWVCTTSHSSQPSGVFLGNSQPSRLI
jgi:hypothetical protein